MKFSFTDRLSYLAWREEWKANYAAISADIRQAKRRRKEYLRTYETYQTPQGKARKLISKIPNPETGDMSGLWRSGEATAELERLKEAKALSWSLKLAAKAAAAAD